MWARGINSPARTVGPPRGHLSRSSPPLLDLDRPGPSPMVLVRWMQNQRPRPPLRSRARDPNARARARDAAGREPLDPGSTAHVLCSLRTRTRFTLRSWAVRLRINGHDLNSVCARLRGSPQVVSRQIHDQRFTISPVFVVW